MCCLLSHGSEGTIAGTDDEDITIKEIGAHLNGDGCKSLVGKPKMFFIQACRGDSYDEGVHTSGVGVDSDTKIPKEADFLFGFATPSGYVAHTPMDLGISRNYAHLSPVTLVLQNLKAC